MTHIGDDEGAVPELELRTMRLEDPHALDKAECDPQPLDGRPYVRVVQHRNDHCLGDGTVALHLLKQTTSLGKLGRVSARCTTPTSRWGMSTGCPTALAPWIPARKTGSACRFLVGAEGLEPPTFAL